MYNVRKCFVNLLQDPEVLSPSQKACFAGPPASIPQKMSSQLLLLALSVLSLALQSYCDTTITIREGSYPPPNTPCKEIATLGSHCFGKAEEGTHGPRSSCAADRRALPNLQLLFFHSRSLRARRMRW